MKPGKREAEQALIKVGCSRKMAKTIISKGLPGYRESLTAEERAELGLNDKPHNADAVTSLLERADSLTYH